MMHVQRALRQQRVVPPLTCRCACGAEIRPGYRERVRPAGDLRRSSIRHHSSAAASTAALQNAAAGPSTLAPRRAATLGSFFRQSFLAVNPSPRPSDRDPQSEDVREHAKIASSEEEESARKDGTLVNPDQLSVPAHVRPPAIASTSLEALPPISAPAANWRTLAQPQSLMAQLTIYKQLAKGRLSAWVVLTAMAGYAMCPTDPASAVLAMEALMLDTFGNTASIAAAGLPESAINAFRVTTLLATAAGTALCSASANTFNQLIEIPYDAQMPRTAKRPLPSHLITPLHAFAFGTVSGVAGTALLYTCVNPLVASLGLLNIILYAAVYTPLKRLSVVNTWIGAIVGGIPPLMGWAACTNSLDPFSGQAGAWVLSLILFAWQFPHFNALSWTIRSEYARSGYRMLSAVDPGMNARVSLRWTFVGAVTAAVVAPIVGLTSWTVGMLSLVPSGALGLYAWRFWRAGSASSLAAARQHGVSTTVRGARATDRDPRDAPARSLFFISLVHLPALLFMMMAGKFGFEWFNRNDSAEAPLDEGKSNPRH